MATRLIADTVLAAITKANYAANKEQVAQLAMVVVAGMDADATYLRVLIAHMQSRLGKPRRGTQPPQEPVLNAVHDELYPSVLEGVGGEGPERDSRANFARSAASTVRYFIRYGGDVRGLKVSEVTKSGLRRAVQPEAPTPEDETRPQKSFRLAQEKVLSAAKRLARGDPDDARQRLEQLMEQLGTLLNELDTEQPDVGGQTTTLVGKGFNPVRTRVGAVQIHKGAARKPTPCRCREWSKCA